jgi:hypothetical protein
MNSLPRWYDRYLNRLFDSISNLARLQISGSKAEGLDMKGSDTDIMILCGTAHENNGEHVTEYLSSAIRTPGGNFFSRNIRRAPTMNSLPRWYDRYLNRLFDSISNLASRFLFSPVNN